MRLAHLLLLNGYVPLPSSSLLDKLYLALIPWFCLRSLLLKTFYIVGGMPAAVTEWIESRSYLECSHIHNDILDTYQDDFAKYKSRISPVLLRKALRSVALQTGGKFVYRQVAEDLHSSAIKEALHLLTLAGLVKPVVHTDGNGLPLGAEANESYIKYLFL